ncbi:MAG: tetratricopeptide repeat protein [Nitrospiraceae bacterium]|nr:MAG: tetratricopeptide repeat protein [Nitrospiraceae bacterium]
MIHMLQSLALLIIKGKIHQILTFLFTVVIAFYLSSCSTAPSRGDVSRAETHHRMGSSYMDNGQYNEAFVEFKKALEFNPDKKETLNYLGYLNMRFKEYDKAVVYFKKAISIDPGYAEAMNNLGVTYAEIGKWDEAIRYFDAALSNPVYETPEMAYANMGYVYYLKGDYINAEKVIKEALMRNNLYPMASYVLGLVYTKLENDDAAIEEFKKAIGLAPDYAEAHMDLAKTYLRSGSRAKALKHFEAVLEHDDNPLRLREASEYISGLKY